MKNVERSVKDYVQILEARVDRAAAARGGQYGKKYLNENYAHSLNIISAQNSITFCLSLAWMVYENI